MRRLHNCITPNEGPVYDAKLHIIVRLQSKSFEEYGILLNFLYKKSTLIRSGSSSLGPTYNSSRTIVGQTRFYSFGEATSLGEGKL